MRKANQNVQITQLKVENYRLLRNIDINNIIPMTTFLGHNGSGKSTIFDVFAFLSECFTEGLRKAWDSRGRFRELRSIGETGPIQIALTFQGVDCVPYAYWLQIDENDKGPFVLSEFLAYNLHDQVNGPDFIFTRVDGEKTVENLQTPFSKQTWDSFKLSSPDLLAVNVIGQLEKHHSITALREFITGWHLSYLSAQDARGAPDAGPREHLSKTGDNLANVIQYLQERHPEKLNAMFDTLRRRVPRLERVDAEVLADGRLLLQIKDAPFERPILSRFASDGTLKLLAYLVLLHDPEPYPLIGIEEPENFLYPKLLTELAEECNLASARTQLLVTTHSPYFVNGLQPEQVQVLYRGEDGYTQVKRVADIPGIKEMMDEGAKLGDLWMEGHFGVGDPEGY